MSFIDGRELDYKYLEKIGWGFSGWAEDIFLICPICCGNKSPINNGKETVYGEKTIYGHINDENNINSGKLKHNQKPKVCNFPYKKLLLLKSNQK